MLTAQMNINFFNEKEINKIKQVKHIVDNEFGYCIIKKFPLKSLSESKIINNFSNFLKLFGIISHSHGPNQQWISRVQARPNLNHKFAYSESNFEIPPHTDNAWSVIPDKYMSLLAIQPADEGGYTKIFSIKQILEQLVQTTFGNEVINILKTNIFPFAAPPESLTETQLSEQKNLKKHIALAPILGKNNTIRYRYDIIQKGFRFYPELATEENIFAVETFNVFLTKFFKNCEEIRLEKEDILLANNHLVLHSRTSFTDPARLLLRARLQE